MKAESRLLAMERVVPPGNRPAEARLFGITRLVVAGGRERIAAEYRALAEESGLKLRRVARPPRRCA
jgi:hypothetical protein